MRARYTPPVQAVDARASWTRTTGVERVNVRVTIESGAPATIIGRDVTTALTREQARELRDQLSRYVDTEHFWTRPPVCPRCGAEPYLSCGCFDNGGE